MNEPFREDYEREDHEDELFRRSARSFSSRSGREPGGLGRPWPPDLPPQRPPRWHVGRPDSSSRTVLWVLVAVITGFFLPVCACLGLILTSTLSFSALLSQLSDYEQETGPAVGVIDLNGPIATGDTWGATTGNIKRQLEWMVDEDDVKAIVIRANSPGGGVNASDEIWAAVRDVEDKPVVVYVHGMCASGCLYIASGSDEIIASRNSLIGSIGVISTFFDVSELLDEVGIDVQTIITGESKDFGSYFRALTPEERDFWREQMAVVLEHFIEVVANRDGSTLTVGDVRELATGDVWIAPQALDLGLIDQLGYENDALDYAASLANLGDDYRIQEYPFSFNPLDLFSGPGIGAEGYFDLPSTTDVLDSLQQPGLQYRYFGPYEGPSASGDPPDGQVSAPEWLELD